MLMDKALVYLKRDGHDVEDYIKDKGRYISFDRTYNKYSVFNMCYIGDILSRALFAVSLKAVPQFSVLDVDGENYFNQYFYEINHEGREEFIGDQKYARCKILLNAPDWNLSLNDRIAYGKIYSYFFKLKSEICDDYEEEYRKIRQKTANGNLIGVVARGTDYLILKPKGHPIQPNLQVVIDYLKDSFDFSKDYLYVATDEKRLLSEIDAVFGGRVITSESEYYDSLYDSKDPYISHISFERDNDKYLKGFDYFKRVFVLSKCDGMVGGMNGAMRAANIMHGSSYNYEKIFFYGLYE